MGRVFFRRDILKGLLAPAVVSHFPLFAAAPRDWVPMRWTWNEPATLDLLSGSPVNCLLLKNPDAAFAEAASKQGIATLAVIMLGEDAVAVARKAAQAKLQGVVLDGDFPAGTAERVRETGAFVVEMPSRQKMKLGSDAPVLGTYEGIWPGVQVLAGGAAKAAPTGSPWIDTNTGFIRAARAWGDAVLWIGCRPPAKTVITGVRYLQVVCDAAMAGARWVVTLDDDFAARLRRHEAEATRDWQRISQYLKYFEDHREWRSFRPYGKLAVVQDPASGSLASAGILDMIAARHTPVLSIPRERLTTEALKDAAMAVNLESLSPEQSAVLKKFTSSGGTLLTAPPGWKDESSMDRLNDLWKDVQLLIGRRNLGVRLFNVSSMLSNMASSADGSQVLLQMVNYSAYPLENITAHFPREYRRARLFTPEDGEREVSVYKTDDGTGVDIDKVSVCAALRLD